MKKGSFFMFFFLNGQEYGVNERKTGVNDRFSGVYGIGAENTVFHSSKAAVCPIG